jgi:hypothetical protein
MFAVAQNVEGYKKLTHRLLISLIVLAVTRNAKSDKFSSY